MKCEYSDAIKNNPRNKNNAFDVFYAKEYPGREGMPNAVTKTISLKAWQASRAQAVKELLNLITDDEINKAAARFASRSHRPAMGDIEGSYILGAEYIRDRLREKLK